MAEEQNHDDKLQSSKAYTEYRKILKEFELDDFPDTVVSEDSTDDCMACGRPMRGSHFCKNCGRPELPPDEQVYRLSALRTFAIIILMVLSFTIITITKLDIDINLFEKEPREEPVVTIDKRPKEKDFKLINVVNVPMANVRQRPSSESIIVMVLKKDTHVEVLEKKKKWSHILVKDNSGWISNQLLTGQVE